MTIPKLASLFEWRSPENLRVIARHLVEQVEAHEDVKLSQLSSSPIEVLEECAHITIRYSKETGTACELAGYYHARPPTITLHPSPVEGRDNFTVLHEYGHHLQQHDPEWALGVLAELPDFAANVLEERVSDAFASAVLFPDSAVDRILGSALTAKFVAELHKRSSASRAAACMKAIEVAPPGVDVFVAQTNAEGRVMFARSNSDSLYVAPFGSVQEDFARLFAEASAHGGRAQGAARAGLRYSTGNSRSDLNIDVALDYSGFYGFAVVTPTYKYGSEFWQPEERECNSPSCEHIFTWTNEVQVCPRCNEPKCPACTDCACEKVVAMSCSNCFMELSVAETASGQTVHDECP